MFYFYKMKRIFLTILGLSFVAFSWAQQATLLCTAKENRLLHKQFPLLSLALDKGIRAKGDSLYIDFQKDTINEQIFTKTFSLLRSNSELLKNNDITHIQQLHGIANTSKDSIIYNALRQEILGINQIIKVYGLNEKPEYDHIDAGDVFPNEKIDKNLIFTIQEEFAPLYNEMPPLFTYTKFAISLLELNDRTNAIDFEPLEKTENAAALKKINTIHWKEWKYSHLLIPGYGPEDGANISPMGILRCKLAAQYYFAKMAPFIIVSGGRVHPNKTKFNEAWEMKKYLMDNYNIPSESIIIEPHARHTTTNIRNTVRLLMKYHFPLDKLGVIATTQDQSYYIANPNFDKRCQDDMHVIPYLKKKQIYPSLVEYIPNPASVIINEMDPLDP